MLTRRDQSDGPRWLIVGTRRGDLGRLVLAELHDREAADREAAALRRHLEGYAAVVVEDVTNVTGEPNEAA